MTSGPNTVADAAVTLVDRARRFAEHAHGAIGQRRKYTGEPYVAHLKRVAALVETVTAEAEAIAAAWLHDVVEDTPATRDDVESEFGATVAMYVDALTDAVPSRGNRAERKAIDRERLAHSPTAVQTVKLADLIDNAEDIARHDRHFARVYLREMAALLEVLTRGDPKLLAQARALHLRLSRSR